MFSYFQYLLKYNLKNKSASNAEYYEANVIIYFKLSVFIENKIEFVRIRYLCFRITYPKTTILFLSMIRACW